MEIVESIKYYEKSINNRIQETKSEFEFVYQILHPFEINKEGKEGIYNEKLEEQIFEYRLANLILKHFGTLEGFSDEVMVDEDFVVKRIIDNSFKISDTKTWFSIKRDGKRLTKEEHPKFVEELHEIANLHFEKSDNWDYHTDDDVINNKYWTWENLTWKSMCKKYKIPFDSSIRFSRIWNWINENGYPTNIRFPREWLDEETKKQIEEVAKNHSAKINIWGNYDAYVTIVGCSKEIKNELMNLGLELTEEK
ncbi:MAG: hypothetical protein IPM36_09560 [Lewinellaceae bacterium]|nr:hypothetical protein [Lewinellaceae bacterium]